MKEITAYVKPMGPNPRTPTRAYEGDAGFDLAFNGNESFTIPPLECADIPCGVAIQWPKGMWGFLVGRSSTFRSKGLMVNPAIIDAGFRGELFAIARNITHRPVVVHPGDRIAQIIPMPLMAEGMVMRWSKDLAPTMRGDNGLGSTGA